MRLQFFIPGLPAPGGSKRAFIVGGKARLVDDCKRNKPWRATCAGVALEALGERPLFDGPLALEMTFVLPRPKGHFGTGRNAATVKPSAPKFPAVKPDATKLLRAAEDALTHVVWVDDALIVEQRVRKVYGPKPGVHVLVRELTGLEPDAPIPADVPARADWPPQVGRSLEPEDCDREPALF